MRGIDPEDAFMAGMMFDVGVFATICAVPDTLADCDEEEGLAILQQPHREMGGRLLAHREMPDMFISLASHHGIEADDRPREILIDASQFLLNTMGYANPFDPIPEGVDVLQYPPIKRLGLNDTHLVAIEVELEDNFAHVKDIFS